MTNTVYKESKKGRITLYNNEDGYFTDLEGKTVCVKVLETVFEDGKLLKDYTFEEVRKKVLDNRKLSGTDKVWYQVTVDDFEIQ